MSPQSLRRYFNHRLGLEVAAIVEQLHATRATAKEREENLQKIINEEARRLKDETVGDGGRGRRDVADRDLESGCLKGQRQMLDLESLSFDQGGLLMANKKCDLSIWLLQNSRQGI